MSAALLFSAPDQIMAKVAMEPVVNSGATTPATHLPVCDRQTAMRLPLCRER